MPFLLGGLEEEQLECVVTYRGQTASVWVNQDLITPRLMRRLRLLGRTLRDDDSDSIFEIASILAGAIKRWEFYATHADEEAGKPLPIETETLADFPIKLLTNMLNVIITNVSAEGEEGAGQPSSGTSDNLTSIHKRRRA